MALTKELIRRLPKAELHVHLDGCLRPETMIALADEAGVSLPSEDPQVLAEAMLVRDVGSLEEYLERYNHTLALLQMPSALERVAYEFVVDVARENVRYVEVRFGPALHVPAMSLSTAIEAPLAGIKRAVAETGTRVSLILCALRTMHPSVSNDVAHAAVDYRDEGVVAFDLAGSERGHPARDHAAAFNHALRHGLSCTCHAGEGDGPDSVRQALHDCGAMRIGHGTRVHEDPALEEYIRDEGIPLEVCLSSNVHTRTVEAPEQHPVRRYLDAGCVVTLNTDGRLMDGVSLTDEYWTAYTRLGFTREEIDRVILNSFESAFLPDDERTELVAEISKELGEIS